MDNAVPLQFDNRQKYIELGYNIAYYRKHAGLTQEQLAEKPGISRQHLGGDRGTETLPSDLTGAAFQSLYGVGG